MAFSIHHIKLINAGQFFPPKVFLHLGLFRGKITWVQENCTTQSWGKRKKKIHNQMQLKSHTGTKITSVRLKFSRSYKRNNPVLSIVLTQLIYITGFITYTSGSKEGNSLKSKKSESTQVSDVIEAEFYRLLLLPCEL